MLKKSLRVHVHHPQEPLGINVYSGVGLHGISLTCIYYNSADGSSQISRATNLYICIYCYDQFTMYMYVLPFTSVLHVTVMHHSISLLIETRMCHDIYKEFVSLIILIQCWGAAFKDPSRYWEYKT